MNIDLDNELHVDSEVITSDIVAKHYLAALDSVAVIADPASDLDAVKRNVEHLKIMLDKPYWTTQDLSPLTAAVQAGTDRLDV